MTNYEKIVKTQKSLNDAEVYPDEMSLWHDLQWDAKNLNISDRHDALMANYDPTDAEKIQTTQYNTEATYMQGVLRFTLTMYLTILLWTPCLQTMPNSPNNVRQADPANRYESSAA